MERRGRLERWGRALVGVAQGGVAAAAKGLRVGFGKWLAFGLERGRRPEGVGSVAGDG
jgi:hypothetical protein